MYVIVAKAQPITGRGVGYKLFSQELISSMKEMPRVYGYLKEAREEGIVPWHWIVDETREVERVSTWDDPAQYVRAVSRSYRRNFWNEQSQRVVVWSEKGTVRGVLAPVLDTYARPSNIGVSFSVSRVPPGRLKVLDDGISMNLIQLSAWLDLRCLQARHRVRGFFIVFPRWASYRRGDPSSCSGRSRSALHRSGRSSLVGNRSGGRPCCSPFLSPVRLTSK